MLRMDRGVKIGLALGAYWALASAQCTFPEYNYGGTVTLGGGGVGGRAGGGSGSGGDAAGSSGEAGMSDGGSVATPAGGEAGAGRAGLGGVGGEAGSPPECPAEQWPVEHCASGCLVRYPDHCYDGKANDDEVAVDCGGSCQRCTRETCTKDDDCLSGKCVVNAGADSTCFAPLAIELTPNETHAVTSNVAWSVTLYNRQPDGGEAYTLKDLKLRYYFERSGIVEPLLVRTPQSSTLHLANGENRDVKQTLSSIQREEHRPDGEYDAYVEVGFGDTVQLFPRDRLDLHQQLITGDPSTSTFDQRTHYSFTAQTAAPSLHLTVFYKGQLVWGLEPRPADPRGCFARGVNLNGPALSIADNSYQSAQDALVTTTGAGVSQAGTPFPAVSGAAATLLQTATHLQASETLTVPTDNGTYLVYLYATSPTNDVVPSTFTVQGTEPEITSKFRSQTVDTGQAWARIGPFRVDVTSGKVMLGVTNGAINFAGIELWYPD